MTDFYTFDFGFEGRSVYWEDAAVAMLFASNVVEENFDTAAGPTAIADASRFIELYEMQVGVSPMDVGIYAEIMGGDDPVVSVRGRAEEAMAAGKIPIMVGGDRRIAKEDTGEPLIIVWGKLGRPEVDEAALFGERQTILVGVRAAASSAFKALKGDVTIVPPKVFNDDPEALSEFIGKVEFPVHLSVDLDVLSPCVVQYNRSVEPGGLSWYSLMELMEMIILGPGVSKVSIAGTREMQPRTPAAALGAQLLLNISGLIMAKKSK